jgi:membrane dipeptidase
VLVALAANGGVVMVNFAPPYVSAARNHWQADLAAEQARNNTPPFGGLYMEYIRRVAGVDHVGLGSDFDGIPDAPVGLEGVNRYPALL